MHNSWQQATTTKSTVVLKGFVLKILQCLHRKLQCLCQLWTTKCSLGCWLLSWANPEQEFTGQKVNLSVGLIWQSLSISLGLNSLTSTPSRR